MVSVLHPQSSLVINWGLIQMKLHTKGIIAYMHTHPTKTNTLYSKLNKSSVFTIGVDRMAGKKNRVSSFSGLELWRRQHQHKSQCRSLKDLWTRQQVGDFSTKAKLHPLLHPWVLQIPGWLCSPLPQKALKPQHVKGPSAALPTPNPPAQQLCFLL